MALASATMTSATMTSATMTSPTMTSLNGDRLSRRRNSSEQGVAATAACKARRMRRTYDLQSGSKGDEEDYNLQSEDEEEDLQPAKRTARMRRSDNLHSDDVPMTCKATVRTMQLPIDHKVEVKAWRLNH